MRVPKGVPSPQQAFHPFFAEYPFTVLTIAFVPEVMSRVIPL